MLKRNEGHNESATPNKRARLMPPADGFSKPKPKTVPISKPSAPKFTSGFDVVPPPLKRPLKSNEVRKPGTTRFVEAEESDIRATVIAKPKHAMRALKPPVPLFNPGPKPVADSLPAPRLLPLPIFPPPSTKNAALRQLAPPPAPSAPIASSSKLTAPLKPLVPPPRPGTGTPSSIDRSLRTISTTLIARATDLFTDNGASELASIFLHDQHPDIQFPSTSDDVEERRGIMVSPEKSGKGKEKLVRNGLAARAAALYDRCHTSLALWEAEMAHSLSSSGPLSRRSVNPDIRLRIIHILHVPSPVPHPSSRLSIPGVALCHLLSAPTDDPLAPSLPRSNDGICAVLFSFSSVSPPAHPEAQAQLAIRNPEDFAEGREVYAWKPWRGVPIDAAALKLCLESGAGTDSAEELAPDPTAFDLFRPGAAGARRRGNISEMALVCERFVVLK
ncbi:hypothetical protein DFH07DRAFT_321456 [Mycena maculata]|uniref:Uncharacterized protein n=1 Tax=Mycena maculata TaxID=230809 RepID=A0AAD7KDH9_9AGAR|nr:hypothetical protein DFH07DRAFT_321456 [Mycena maculata]